MTLRQLVTPTNVLLAVLLLGATVAGFILIPAGTILPVHWNVDGQVDGSLPRDGALLLLPGVVLLVWVIFYLVGRFYPADRTSGGRYAGRVVLSAITAMMLAIECGIIATGLGYPVDMVRIVACCIGLLLVVLGNVMPKTQPNGFAGIRIPTTLRDSANWQATHRLAGMLMVVTGLLLAVAAALTASAPVLFGCILAAVFVPLVVGTIYSVSLSRRRSA